MENLSKLTHMVYGGWNQLPNTSDPTVDPCRPMPMQNSMRNSFFVVSFSFRNTRCASFESNPCAQFISVGSQWLLAVVHIEPGGIFEKFGNLAQGWGGWGYLVFTLEPNIAEMNVSDPSKNTFLCLEKICFRKKVTDGENPCFFSKNHWFQPGTPCV